MMSTTCNYLFLDDRRSPEQAGLYKREGYYLYAEWDVVRNYNDFVTHIYNYFLTNASIPFISFDHDISDFYTDSNGELQERTGLTCAKWLIDFCLDFGIGTIEFNVHSSNPAGAENIKSILNQFNNKK